MSDKAPFLIYYVGAIILVLSSLVTMKLPVGKALKMAAAWVAIFAGVFVLFAFRGNFVALGQRLKAEAIGSPIVEGSQIRIPIGEDGHFWVEGMLNGRPARFLVDSGASVTTISTDVARAAGVPMTGLRGVVNTANGRAPVIQANAKRLEVGSIARNDFPIDINDADDTNVLGMNFLRSLSSWRVEGNDLVLLP